ncbi:MAG: TVP38/TMEM64 family protein [Planctomycetaceae bacterium]
MSEPAMNDPESEATGGSPTAGTGFPATRILLLLAVAGAAFGVYAAFGDSLTLQKLAGRESELRVFQQNNAVLVFGLAFVIYVTVTGLSLPGAAVLSLAYAWFFGFVPALVLVSFASTTGASVAFLLSRYILGDAIQKRFASRLQTFNKRLETEGAFYLFTLRLIPAVPFFVINVVMGLTRLPLKTFWWVSQVGMLPGTAVYVWAGSSVPDLETLAAHGLQGILTPKLAAAFIVLGLFPLVVRKLVMRFGAKSAATDYTPSGAN